MDFLTLAAHLLSPPGSGIHTVSNGKERKEQLQKTLYQSNQADIVEQRWKQQLKDQLGTKNLALLSYPCDTGAAITRGSNWGPLYLRQLIQSKNLCDLGDVAVIPQLLSDEDTSEQTKQRIAMERYPQELRDQLPVAPLSILKTIAAAFFQDYPDQPLLTLGGDHSLSYPIVHGWLKRKKREKKKLGILHFDAHTDLMPQRLGIQHCFATWAYHALAELHSAQHLLQVGIRSSAQNQQYWQQNLGLRQIWANEFRHKGLDWAQAQILEHFEKLGVQELYLSVDIDALDSEYASATGTAEANGLFPHEIIQILQTLKASDLVITAADLVEVAPPLAKENDETLSWAQLILEQMIGNLEA